MSDKLTLQALLHALRHAPDTVLPESPEPHINAPASPKELPDAPFDNWYVEMAQRYNLNWDPTAQYYDYRGAHRAGASPDRTKHWPSGFKQRGHPNEVVGGFNTRTGMRVRGTPHATADELIALGWDEAFARANGRR